MTIRERAITAALNFAGLTISSADGTYDTLILVISDAMQDYAKAAIEEEREACAGIADREADTDNTQWKLAAETIAENIRARSS